MTKQVLLIDCCVKGEWSRTLRLARRYLDTLEGCQVTHLRLYDEPLAPLSEVETAERRVIKYAQQFAQADEIVIAAPFWDLSFPAILKLYLEHICITGITFQYVGAEARGLCKAMRAVYISTSGGFVGQRHLGEEYVKTLFQTLFGIEEFHATRCEGLDLPGADPEKMIAEAVL